ncbi:MAG TPA: enoyl-CoA hydratase/isomerase family protein [Candidatus Lokiarchaeia archaeon]|nr:enoyl-CoA hydratase/isomerase family protein [Candidatus Lokiarchaeia archaeon]
MSDDDTILSSIEGKIARITLNNPDKLNVFTIERMQRLIDIFDEIQQNPKVRCVIINAMGERAFCAGLDKAMLSSGDPDINSKILDVGTALSKKIFYTPQFVVGSIAAPAIGWGCILSMLCDFRYVLDNAYFKLPEVELGIFPATGALTLCMAHFGPSLGEEMLFLSRKLSAEEGARIGFVNGVGTTREEIDDLANETAEKLSLLNQQVTMYTKMNARMMHAIEYGKALDLEAQCFKEMLELKKEKNWFEICLERFRAMRESR